MTAGCEIERMRAICAEVGFDLARVDPRVLDRMRLLADRTETVADFERMAATARDLFRYYDTKKPSKAFSEIERRTIVLGCLLSDIGKTGPGGADPSAQRLIVEMFSVEGVRDEKQAVDQFMSTYFPVDAEERVERFVALGLDPRMPMRRFWNLHSAWTLEIVESCGVPAEAVCAAARHHLIDGVNPLESASGASSRFNRAEKLVIILDKYDAVRRRGNRTHDQAIAWLRGRVAENPDFCNDLELFTLIRDLDLVVRSRALATVG